MPEHPEPKIRHATPPGKAPPMIFSVKPCALAYAELAVATNFSFLRGASHPDELVVRAAELGYRAIGVTDLNSLAGVVRMHVAAKEVGLKIVVGTRLAFSDYPDVLAWPTDRGAYARLCRLLTTGKRRAEKGECSLSIYDFLENSQGMFSAIVPPETISEDFERLVRIARDALDKRLSIAAACVYENDNTSRLENILHHSAGVPLLAVNDVNYHILERRCLQDVLTCIRHGCTISEAGFRLFQNGERYLKSPAQMHALFRDQPAAIERGLEIATECTFDLEELKYEYPDELVPPGKTPLEYLSELTWNGAQERYPQGIPEKVKSLLEHELKLIGEMKIVAYFLTVYDIVRFARSRGILCQGRGSAANSAVCYCIGVTSVDPSRIDVLFERFVSAARNEPPDIDVDFEHERREEVIQYLYQKYGRDRAGMTAEVITYRGRSAVRDVGKAMGLGLDLVDQMAKRLDWWDRGTLVAQRITELGLDPEDRTIRMVIELTRQILGFPRHLSQHVGGMVMTRGPLSEMVPIENASMPDRTVIEWDKQDIDDLGILKVDVLGLGMLTCISKSLKLLEGWASAQPHSLGPLEGRAPARSDSVGREPDPPKAPLQMHTIPPEDPAVYEMISDADTIGVFQIESRAQMTMLPRLRPNCFYDLVIEVAIVRPGPIQGNMVHPYLRRRNGEEPVSYPSEALRHVLQKTLGVPLFQEQAMKLAMVGAGFSAEDADRLRRAMASWRKNGVLETFHPKIINGMLKNGYEREFAERCFEQIKGFGEYGFPESHAASFALLVYVSAWIKRYHPAAFCCGLLNSQPMGFYAPAQIVRDAQMHGVPILPVDVNFSEYDCTLEPSGPIDGSDVPIKWNWGVGGPGVRLGFGRIRGCHKLHAERIIQARTKCDGGRFRSIAHFCHATKLPSHTLRLLAEADAFGSLGDSRRPGLWKVMKERDEATPLFDEGSEPRDEPAVKLPTMPMTEEVTADYQTAGLSLKRHPVALIREELKAMHIATAQDLSLAPHGRWIRVAGLVLIRQRPGTASGIVFETLEDETGVVNLIIRPDIYERYRHAARHGTLISADGYVERQGQVVHVMVKRMADLSNLVADNKVRSRDFR